MGGQVATVEIRLHTYDAITTVKKSREKTCVELAWCGILHGQFV